MASQSSKEPTSKIFVRSRPTEPLEIGPLEYRNKTLDLACGVVSDIKYTIRPSAKPQATNFKQPESTHPEHRSKPQTSKNIQPGQSSKQNAITNEGGFDVHRQAQEVVSSIKDTIRPTAKPSNPSEITGSGNDAILEFDGTPSEVGSDGTVILGRSGKQMDIKLSDRMEYLARPKKGVLYQDGFECPEGAIPEKHLPSWKFLPLFNKIPADRFPYEINMAKVSDDLFLPSPNDTMNLDDISDGCLTTRDCNSLLDAGFETEGVRQQLENSGQVTESGRIVCTLKELNDYRKYLARMQARAVQMRLRAEYEEEKRAKEEKRREKADKREEEREMKKTQTALREQIKNTVEEAKQDTVMAAQIERDKKILNRGIRMKQKALEIQEQSEKLRTQRAEEKNEQEKRRKEIELEMAKKDVQRIEKLCKRKEEERLERRRKLEEFWDRKAAVQSEWLEEGFELERKCLKKREKNIKARKAQVWRPKGWAGETLDDILNEEDSSISSGKTLYNEETECFASSKVTPRAKTVSPTSSKEITLEKMLRKEIQSTASYEAKKGNPSREEILTPVSSKEITLENILRKETESRVSNEETSRKETGQKDYLISMNETTNGVNEED